MSKRAFITLLHACAAFAPTPRVGRAPALRVGRGPRPLSAATTDATKDVAELLRTKRAVVDGLAKADPNASEMTRPRFASAFATQSQAAAALRETAAWRAGAGKPIVEAASKAVAEATAAGGWNNEPARGRADIAFAVLAGHVLAPSIRRRHQQLQNSSKTAFASRRYEPRRRTPRKSTAT